MYNVQPSGTSRLLYAIPIGSRVGHRCVGERNRQIESCQQTQITHRVTTDLVRSAIRSAEIAGNVVGVSAASTVEAVVGLGRSTVRGMSSVNQRKDDDDEGAHQGGHGDEA